jgi:thiol-disulfide isomerase/thioredoxin
MGIFGNDNEPKIITDSEIMELKKKHGIVLFYMNGCGHCETMKPSWNKLITELKDKHKNEIILGAIESSSMDMFKTHGINPAVSGFPTILYFQPGRHNMPEHYKGDRSYEDLKKWILTKKGKGKGKKVSNESLVILTNNANNANNANNTNNANNANNINTGNKKTKIKNGMGKAMGVGTGKAKGVAFSQFGGGSSRTKKRRLVKRRRSHKRRGTSMRKNSRRRVRR